MVLRLTTDGAQVSGTAQTTAVSNNGNTVKKTEGAKGTQAAAKTDENTLQELDTEGTKSKKEVLDSEKSTNDATKQSFQQIELIKKQISSLNSQKMMIQGDSSIAASDKMSQCSSINSQITNCYSQIENILRNIGNLQDQLVQARQDNNVLGQPYQTGVGGVNTTGYQSAGSSKAGNAVIDMAKQFEDKAAGEMSKIMRSKGSAYHEGLWCADFVSFVLKETYGKDGTPGNFLNTCPNTASCASIMNWAEQNGCWTKNSSGLQPGDLVIFDWDGDGGTDHVGFFISQNPDGTINTIEGNTSGSAGGSCVESKKRNMQNIRGFVKLSQFK